LGIDVGGTFTDLVLVGDGRIRTHKLLTTPDDPAQAVLVGIDELLRLCGADGSSLQRVVHATTLMSNALVEGTGARTALVTTAGFRDLIAIGRESRYDIYDLALKLPLVLVPRTLRYEIAERITGSGDIGAFPDERDVTRVVSSLRDEGVEAVAIVFLHSYANDAHETQVRTAIAGALGGIYCSMSSEVAREIREYERTTTTVANAYVGPLVQRYLTRIESELAKRGTSAPLHIMVSSGGFCSAETARRVPVRAIESGPAAGALSAAFYARRSGYSNVLGFDMGGTTAKLCVVTGGQPTVTFMFEVARLHRFKKGSGLPIRAPSIELMEIGAGGGSIARFDEVGLLRVGPSSSGANPGPACYGRGGLKPTVTDANLVLGYLSSSSFLGGAMVLDEAAARTAIDSEVAQRLSLDVPQAAWAIYEVVTESMANAARVYIAERGQDPRNFTIVATGGAGPLHACALARRLRVSRILFPLHAGLASTIGLIVSRPTFEIVRSYRTPLTSVDWDLVLGILDAMRSQALEELGRAGVDQREITVRCGADMRYLGQGHELHVAVPLEAIGSRNANLIDTLFRDAYRRQYGIGSEEVAAEIVTWRLFAFGPDTSGQVARIMRGGKKRAPAAVHPRGRPAYFGPSVGYVRVPVHKREDLLPGARGKGPAIIEERESTAVIAPGSRFRVDDAGNLIVDLPKQTL
jgi:N-methylhydantoinase A